VVAVSLKKRISILVFYLILYAGAGGFNAGSSGAGGAGGGTAQEYLTGLTIGNTLVLTIGAAGSGGAAGGAAGKNGAAGVIMIEY